MPLISISLTDIPLSDMPLGIFAFIAGTFLIAGIVKGLTGLGLPAMSLGLLMVALELRDAMVILVIPLFATNVWQGVTGGNLRTALIRLWPLFSTGVIGIWFAVGVMVTINPTILSIVLGAILIVYAAYSLATPQIRPFGRWEIILSPMAGAITGVIGGLTGSMAVPSVPYMQALGMKRDALIQAMGIWFCLGSIALGGALSERNAFPVDLAIVSAGAVIPAIFGMDVGRRLRQRLSEERFRKVFFTALILLGLYITGRGAFQLYH